jgi:hypothetical protein
LALVVGTFAAKEEAVLNLTLNEQQQLKKKKELQ